MYFQRIIIYLVFLGIGLTVHHHASDDTARCFLEIGRILKEGWSQQDLPDQGRIIRKNLERWIWCPKNQGGYHFAKWRSTGLSTTEAISLKKDGESHQYSLTFDEFQNFWLRVPRRRGFMADNFPVNINSLSIHYYPYARAKAISQTQETSMTLKVETTTKPINLAIPAKRATLQINAKSRQLVGKLKKIKRPPRLLVTVGHGEYRLDNFPDELFLASWRQFSDFPSRENLIKMIVHYERAWKTFGNLIRK